MLINQVPEVSVMPEAWTLYYLLDLNCKKEGSVSCYTKTNGGAMIRN